MAAAKGSGAAGYTPIADQASDPSAPWLHTIKPGVSSKALAIWSLPRQQVELIYKDVVTAGNREAMRFLCRNDRYFLLTCLLRRADMQDEHIRDWIFLRCREIEADPDDHIDLWARDHYKSSCITFAGIVQEILINPEITVCIFSYKLPAAKDFVNQIKLEFEDNDKLKDLFPEVLWKNPQKEAPWWSLDDGIVVKRNGNPKEATLEASGLIDGMSTGKHFGLRVYDDVVTEETVTTPEMVSKTTIRWELSDNLGTKGGRVWMIGTRYSFSDTYGVILERGVFKERRHAATHDGTFDGIPVLLTREAWQRKLSTLSKPTIAAQQLLNPLAGSETRFDVRWLQTWVIRPRRLSVYIMVDPSMGATSDSDLTALCVIGMDANRNKYLLGGFAHRMALSRRWTLLRDAYRAWSRTPGIDTVQVGYERYGLQTDLEYFEERMETEQFHFPITELAWPNSGPKSKEQRIMRLEPDLRMGRLRIPAVWKFDQEGRKTAIDARQTSEAQMVIRQNEAWRIAGRIIAKDEDDRVYDVLERFLEEYIFFPFAPRRDFLDAMSRIYDMDPAPPIAYDADGIAGLPTEPEYFPDS